MPGCSMVQHMFSMPWWSPTWSQGTRACSQCQWQLSTCVIHLLTLDTHCATAINHFHIVITSIPGCGMLQLVFQCHDDLPSKVKVPRYVQNTKGKSFHMWSIFWIPKTRCATVVNHFHIVITSMPVCSNVEYMFQCHGDLPPEWKVPRNVYNANGKLLHVWCISEFLKLIVLAINISHGKY